MAHDETLNHFDRKLCGGNRDKIDVVLDIRVMLNRVFRDDFGNDCFNKTSVIHMIDHLAHYIKWHEVHKAQDHPWDVNIRSKVEGLSSITERIDEYFARHQLAPDDTFLDLFRCRLRRPSSTSARHGSVGDQSPDDDVLRTLMLNITGIGYFGIGLGNDDHNVNAGDADHVGEINQDEGDVLIDYEPDELPQDYDLDHMLLEYLNGTWSEYGNVEQTLRGRRNT